MARKKLINFNIDKLKVCYHQPQELFDEFAQYPQKKTIYRDGYDLYIVPDEDDRHIRLSVSVGGVRLGILTLNNTKQCEGLCFFRFENRACYFNFDKQALYDVLTMDVATGQKYNLINVWESIADDLGLVFNNITELEIACDTNFNLSAKVRKMIKDYQNYEMFCNGKKISDPNRIIENYHETFARSRKRLQKYPTIYFEQARTDAPLLRIYNKSDEIEANDNEKDYITEWNGFAPIYRTEVRIKSNSFKEFLKTYTPDADYSSPLQMIQSPHFLFSAWQFFTDRLIFFRDMDGNDIHLSDLLGK